MSDIINKEPITEQDYIDAAHHLGCKVAAIKAVAEVESSGSGYLSTGELVILFEPHVFWKRLQKYGIDPAKVLAEHPDMSDILYQKFKGHSGEHPSQQWGRLNRAAQIHMKAAYESASWGKFQVMGFNCRSCGWDNVFDMVKAYQEGEKYQLLGFVDLVMDFGLGGVLVREDWVAFAKGYNGPAYKTNRYDEKLAAAFKKYDI
jgi:hypothetical protein